MAAASRLCGCAIVWVLAIAILSLGALRLPAAGTPQAVGIERHIVPGSAADRSDRGAVPDQADISSETASDVADDGELSLAATMPATTGTIPAGGRARFPFTSTPVLAGRSVRPPEKPPRA